jgi:flagellar assembly protein FliH
MARVVIKAGEQSPIPQGGLRLELRDVSQKIEHTIHEAKREAEVILQSARSKASAEQKMHREKARREGEEAGIALGRKQGYEQALAEAREKFTADQGKLAAALTGMAAEFSRRREEFYVAAKQDAVLLGIEIARRLAGRLPEIGDPSEGAQEAARAALELVGKATEVMIRLHPEDRAALKKLVEASALGAPALDSALNSTRNVQLIEDASVERGGVLVQTADCELDATVGGRLDRIADELMSQWRQRRDALGIK